jgi:hypothetical protein
LNGVTLRWLAPIEENVMRHAMRTALLGISILFLPSVVPAQTPQPAATSTAEVAPYVIHYEPGNVLPLPIQTCEIQAIEMPRPYQVKLPVKVKIHIFDIDQLKIRAKFFEGLLQEPKKLDPGYYAIEAEGVKDPIIVAYAMEDVWPVYFVYKEPDHALLGPFVIPGVGRLPTGQYSAHGVGFDLTFECRNKERAAFHVPTYQGLPPFLAPAQGVAW